VGCGGGHGGHGGHMFSHRPDKKDSSNGASCLGLMVLIPFLIGLAIFCLMVVGRIGIVSHSWK